MLGLGRIRGAIDAVDCYTVNGFAFEEDSPGTPANIDLYVDNVKVRSTQVSGSRPDLQQTFPNIPNVVWNIPTYSVPSLNDGRPHSLVVTANGQPLPSSGPGLSVAGCPFPLATANATPTPLTSIQAGNAGTASLVSSSGSIITGDTIISGIPNYLLIGAGVFALFMFKGKR